MKSIRAFSVCLLIGVGIGWYVGNSRAAQNQRRVVRELQEGVKSFHLTEHEDALAASIACSAFARLEAGETGKAKHTLATTISIYYRAHRVDGDRNLIAHIEAFAATNAAISNAIYRKRE